MFKPRTFRRSAVAIAVLVAAVALIGLTAARRAQVTVDRYVARTDSQDFVLETTSVDGVVTVKGRAVLPAMPIDQRFWWVVAFRQPDQDGKLVRMFEKEYDFATFDVPSSRSVVRTFADIFAPGPGDWNVLLGLGEMTPYLDQTGNRILPQPFEHATSEWVEVK
jgi:hypothetical protein